VIGLLLRVGALAWLLGVQPLDLALTASRVAFRPVPLAWPALLALAIRVVAVGVGVAAGLSLLRRTPSARTLARAWIVLELGTLALVWTTDAWPSNRPPGGRWPVAVVYALGAAMVGRAARVQRAGGLPTSLRSR